MRFPRGALCALCALALLLPGCSARDQGEREGEYLLYYLNNSQSGHGPALAAEPCPDGELTAQGEPAPDALMGALLRGPEHEELASPFPEGVTLRRWEWDPDQPGNLVVTLSEQYGELSEIALTLADYCIVLTLSQLEGVETVEIQAEGFVGNYRSHQRLSAGEATLWDGVARPEMEATGGGG